MMELKIDWSKFVSQNDSLIEEVHSIEESYPGSVVSPESFEKIYLAWREKVINYYDSAFGERSECSIEFKHANNNKFRVSKDVKSQTNPNEIKLLIRRDIEYLTFNKNILQVSELITSPKQVNIDQREKYTVEETLELILDKLYDLYDDNQYPILPILEGNGIQIKKRREEFDFVELLESRGLVESSFIANRADARITLDGKRYIEAQRKSTKPNYESISDDKETIELKFDELFKKLIDLGYGQEIIFDELNDLKELYSTLSKKNWGELIKGKLIDLGLSQVINADVMKLIYETITNEVLRLR